MPHSPTDQDDAIRRAARTLLSSRYVMALTGAGISVESGIPPFRGPGGLWTKYGEPPMNGYQIFLQDPKKAWEERLSPKGPSKIIWETLGTAEPNPGHHALVELENMGVLRCLITQNVDNLHRRAGSRNLVEIHGNYTLIRCIQCNSRFPAAEVPLHKLPPSCPQCEGILKSDTISFGKETGAKRARLRVAIATCSCAARRSRKPATCRSASCSSVSSVLRRSIVNTARSATTLTRLG